MEQESVGSTDCTTADEALGTSEIRSLPRNPAFGREGKLPGLEIAPRSFRLSFSDAHMDILLRLSAREEALTVPNPTLHQLKNLTLACHKIIIDWRPRTACCKGIQQLAGCRLHSWILRSGTGARFMGSDP
ncbi:hypothetical protein AK812_SmicGene35451 [Symbiodinium microadriaticum]|uniref:Uncharacterized protein n=1 Tax=Symbiodinium microadriaticum TaxID=2951 RepID=A0A1Q9CLE9_SYMMI|nr:hypothetical protein AK812_SmicGene35451 [Symbiodinium microadriaticum]